MPQKNSRDSIQFLYIALRGRKPFRACFFTKSHLQSVRSQASELYAIHTCPLFPVIVHGNVRNLVFKYNNKDEVVGVKLPSLRFANIGSPLLDIYGAVHSAKSGLHETSTALRGKSFSFSRHFLVSFFLVIKSHFKFFQV